MPRRNEKRLSVFLRIAFIGCIIALAILTWLPAAIMMQTVPGSEVACSTAPGTAIGRSDRCLHPELVGAASLALADAFDLGRVERVELEAALTLLLRADLASAGQRLMEHFLKARADDPAGDVANDAAQPRAQQAQLSP